VTTIAGNARPLGLAGYTHFALCDADSQAPGLFSQFGLMTDDYTPQAGLLRLPGTHRQLLDLTARSDT
jgi:hypothetical protein